MPSGDPFSQMMLTNYSTASSPGTAAPGGAGSEGGGFWDTFGKMGTGIANLGGDPMFMLGLQLLTNDGRLTPGAAQNVLLAQRSKMADARRRRAEKLAAEQAKLSQENAAERQKMIMGRLAELTQAEVAPRAARAIVQEEMQTLGAPVPVKDPNVKARIDAMFEEAMASSPEESEVRSFGNMAGQVGLFGEPPPQSAPMPQPAQGGAPQVHQFPPTTIAAPPPARFNPQAESTQQRAGGGMALNPRDLLRLQFGAAMLSGTAEQRKEGNKIIDDVLGGQRQLAKDVNDRQRDAITGQLAFPGVVEDQGAVRPFMAKSIPERLMNAEFEANMPAGFDEMPRAEQERIAQEYAGIASRTKLGQRTIRVMPDGSYVDTTMDVASLNKANDWLRGGARGQAPTAPAGRAAARSGGGSAPQSFREGEARSRDPWGRAFTRGREPRGPSTEESKRMAFSLNTSSRMTDAATNLQMLKGVQNLAANPNLRDVLGSKLGNELSSFIVDPKYRRMNDAMQRVMTDLVYQLSGAQATDKEVAQNIRPFMPNGGDTFRRVLEKMRDLADYNINQARATIPKRIMKHPSEGATYRESVYNLMKVKRQLNSILKKRGGSTPAAATPALSSRAKKYLR